MIQNFKITNLTCEACIKLSTMALKKIPGISDVKIDLVSGDTEIMVEKEIPWVNIQTALKSVGKEASNN